MAIIVDAASLSEEKINYHSHFVIECFSSLAKNYSHYQFIYIVNKFFDVKSIKDKNIVPVVVNTSAKYSFLKNWKYKRKINTIIKQYQASLFISNKTISSIKTPQCLLVDSLAGASEKKISKFLKQAHYILTSSQFIKNKIIKQYNINDEIVDIIYYGARSIFQPVDVYQQTLVKNKHTNGIDYFLSAVSLHSESGLINILKAFSHFKKWQRSSMQLVIVDEYNMMSNEFLNSLQKYKYKADVKIIKDLSSAEIALITASSYAMVYTSLYEDIYLPVVNAMQCGVPVIASINSVVQEIAGEAVLYSNADNVEEIGRQMILLYKDENKRNELIAKGLQQASFFNWDKTLDSLEKYFAKMIG